MIEATHISKCFRKSKVLDDVNLSVGKGEIVCLMGSNGAGKSTLLDILATLDGSFDGEVRLMGLDSRKYQKEIRGKIGYVPGRFSLYEDLSVAENLSFFASVYGVSTRTINQQCPALWNDLQPFAGMRTQYLSGGMQQKLSVCCALVHEPLILLLDEPTTGIDIPSRKELWNELIYMKKQGMTVLVSTHYSDEARMADRILFLHHGVLYPAIDTEQGNIDPEAIFVNYLRTQQNDNA